MDTTIDYFLKEEYFEKATSLIQKQIGNNSNKGKCLEFEIYRNRTDKKLDIKDYYKKYIKGNIFYNNQGKFNSISYLIPKGVSGIRSFNFLSYEELVLFYALGFYLYDLVNPNFGKIEDFKEDREDIFTSYGCSLNYEAPKNSRLEYFPFYIEFNNLVNDKIQEIFSNNKKAVVIKLDIQSFFHSIKFDLLIDSFENLATNSKIKKLNFDENTKNEIKTLLHFINKGNKGLPLFSQNVLSNFLSYIFLYDLDGYCQNLQLIKNKDYLYTRYMDDFYIIYRENKTKKNNEIGDDIFNVISKVSHFLSEKKGLKLNQLKTKKLIISNETEFEEFVKKEKVLSIPDKLKKNNDPRIDFEEVINIIKNLKEQYRNHGKTYLTTEDNNKLNHIFQRKLREYVKSSDAQKELKNVFKNWFQLVSLVNPKVFYFLLTEASKEKEIINFLLTNIKKYDSPHYFYLLVQYILFNKVERKNIEKFKKIKSSNPYHKLIKAALIKSFKLEFNEKDFPLSQITLAKNKELIGQIKLLNIAEIDLKYNVAFNHLLNIFHFYCAIKDEKSDKNLKNYNQKNVIKFLDSLKMSPNDINFGMKIFDIRNKNNISHPSDKKMSGFTVNRREYFKYKKESISLISKIKSCL